MKNLAELLADPGDEGFNRALEMINRRLEEKIPGFILLEELKSIFMEARENPLVKTRIVKISGSLDERAVKPFLEEALDDNHFQVRNAAALTLKLLADEDHYERIYKSDIGVKFKRSFWCRFDFIGDEMKARQAEESRKLLSGFAGMFKKLNVSWTYPDQIKESYFTPGRKKHLAMSEDGRLLFRNFNFSMEKMFRAGKSILHLINNMAEVIEDGSGEKSELEDILRCLKLALGSQLKFLEEGLAGFIAAFHYLRVEYDVCIFPSRCQALQESPLQLESHDAELLKTLRAGFERFDGFQGDKTTDVSFIARQIVFLKKRIMEFIQEAEHLSDLPDPTPRGYLSLKRMGLIAYELGTYCLQLISYWCREE